MTMPLQLNKKVYLLKKLVVVSSKTLTMFYFLASNEKLTNFYTNTNRIYNLRSRSVKNTCTTDTKTQPNTVEAFPYHGCQFCELTFTNKNLYLVHVNQIHKADPHDDSFYCQPCQAKYGTLNLYQKHLRSKHKMKLQPIKSRIDPTIEPDLKDPDFYCKSCKTMYLTQFHYKNHLRSVHRMYFKRNDNLEPDRDDPNFYCKSCDRTYTTRDKFRTHLRSMHDMTFSPTRRRGGVVDPSVPPDPNDPHFHPVQDMVDQPIMVLLRNLITTVAAYFMLIMVGMGFVTLLVSKYGGIYPIIWKFE